MGATQDLHKDWAERSAERSHSQTGAQSGELRHGSYGRTRGCGRYGGEIYAAISGIGTATLNVLKTAKTTKPHNLFNHPPYPH